MNLVMIAAFGYLCGSIATAVWVSKYIYGKDVRLHGSGNAGATNVYRVLGARPALIVTIIDVSKGAIPTALAAQMLRPEITADPVWFQIMAGSFAVVGHCWPVFARFRGGKGVATGAGMLVVLYPVAVPICIAVFALIVYRTRYVSLGSICAAATLPLTQLVSMFFLGREVSLPLLILGGLLLPFVLFTHRSNIQRLIQGNENRIGQKQAEVS